MTLREYKKLSNAALLDRLDVLLTQTRTNLAELITCMGEVERRSRFAAAGYSSMHFTNENVDGLIEAATHRTKLQVQMLIAMRFPQEDGPTSLREIKAQPMFMRMTSDSQQDAEASASPTDVSTVQQTVVPEPVDLTQARPSIALPAERFPVVARLEKQKYATVEAPREPQADSLHVPPTHGVPAQVRRMVRQRDGGQYTFVAAGGHRCESRMRLEFDQIRPVCLGGIPRGAHWRLGRRQRHTQGGYEPRTCSRWPPPCVAASRSASHTMQCACPEFRLHVRVGPADRVRVLTALFRAGRRRNTRSGEHSAGHECVTQG